MKDLKIILLSIKENGIRRTISIYGKKVILIIFIYYLIRDSFVYIFVPYFIFNNL